MNDKCDHYWEPTSPDKDGQPIFKPQTIAGYQKATHAKCRYCGDRTWFTEKQWWAMPGEPYPLAAKPQTFPPP